MSAVFLPLPLGEGWGEGGLRVREPSAKYLAQAEPALLRGFGLLALAPGGVAKLRALIHSLAVRGLLVPHDPNDEPASALIQSVQEEKVTLSEAGLIKRDKPHAPIADDELPYSLPKGWEWIRLRELLTKIGAGSTPLGGREVYTTTGVKFLRSQNVWNSGLSLDGVACIPLAVHKKMSGTKVVGGDLLFNITGASIGRCALVADTFDEGNVSQHVTIIRTVLPSIRQFLHLVLISDHVQQTVMDVQVGVSREGLSIAKLGQFVIPLPPLAEQHRIVARVEELMKLCDALEQSGRLADEQHARLTSTLFDALAASESAHALTENWQRIAEHFDLLLDRPKAIDALEQTILQLAVRGLLVSRESSKALPEKPLSQLPSGVAMFQLPETWMWTALESLLISGPTNGFSPKPSLTDVGVRCLTLSATTKGYFRGECYKLIDISPKVAAQHYLKQGDLLIQRANSLEYVGMAAIYDGNDDDYTFPDLMMRMRVSTALVSIEYLHLWLISKDARAYLRSKATGTQGNMPKVNQGVVRQVPVPVPPLAEQYRIVARVQELRNLCSQLRKRLTDAGKTQSVLADALVAQASAA